MQKLKILAHYLRRKHGYRFESREALERWQEQQVRQHVAWVRASSPFYRERWDGLPDAAWRDFASIDKAAMMANFDALNTVGLSKEEGFRLALEAERSREFSPTWKGITIGLSSGTSGHRGLFLVSPEERTAWAGTILAKVLPGSILSKQRIAFFLRANSNLYTTVGSKRMRFEFFDLLEALEAHLSRLDALQPTLLVAPPSMLRLLAEAQQQGRLAIAPTKIVSVAEVLDPIDEAFVKGVFGQTIHQVYQATEGFLAVTCPAGTLHLNEDMALFEKEWVDAERRVFMPIITDFTRKTQPIVRYRLNDLLVERAEPCPCGSVHTALERIEGRSDDLCYWPAQDGGKPVPVFPDFIRRAILMASPAIREYRVIQASPDVLEVQLRADGAFPEAEVRHQVGELAARLGSRAPEVTFAPYEAPQAGQKLRRVECRR
ncbi:Phenylacetate-coenzyme A ligase [compost metagenome]